MAGNRTDRATFGAKLGERLADLGTRAYLSSRSQVTPHVVKTAMHIQEEFFKLTGFEIVKTVGPLWEQIAAHPDVAPWAKDTAKFAAAGKGQWATLLNASVLGQAMGSSIFDVVNNAIAPSIAGMLASDPNQRLSAEQAAAAWARGVWPYDRARLEAAWRGVNLERFETIAEMNRAHYPFDVGVALLRRGQVAESEVMLSMQRQGFDEHTARNLISLRQVDLTPADLAAMWNRSIVSTEEGREIAARSGMLPRDFDRLTELGGEPLAPQDLLLAFRRGIIDEKRLQRGIVQGPTRTEWFDVLKALQYYPMSTSDALTAWGQGHLSDGELEAIANQNGLRSQDITPLKESAGTAPGIEFMLDALSRGIMTDEQVIAGIKESRPKNKYIPIIMAMRERLVPQETARMLYRKGIISRDEVASILTKHGFNATDVAHLIAAEEDQQTETVKDLTQSQVLELYADRAIDETTAADMLSSLGFAESSVQLLLSLADVRRIRKFIDAAVSRLHTNYVARKLDRTTAIATMDALGVAPAQRDDYLTLWDIESRTVTKALTTAQIVSAAKQGFIDAIDALDRLEGQGYAPDDARILLLIGKVPGVE